jgi:hypothetical protein
MIKEEEEDIIQYISMSDDYSLVLFGTINGFRVYEESSRELIGKKDFKKNSGGANIIEISVQNK